MYFYKYPGQKFMIAVLILVTFIIPQSCYSREEKLRNEAVMSEKDIFLQEYVEKIYQEYADRGFEYVYQQLHPDIKKIITEKEYRDFQEKNFNKYRLKFDEIKVSPDAESIDLPNEFAEIIVGTEGDDTKVYKISLSYNLDLTVAGDEQTRQVDNQVFILEDSNQHYLLWDPYIIKKDKNKEEK